MSNFNATSTDYLLFSAGSLMNYCPFEYWKMNEEETQDRATEDSLAEVPDSAKTFSAIGWYIAGMGECLLGVIGKITFFVTMIFINIGLAVNLAILRNENEELDDRKTRCKAALLILADSAISVGVDLIGVLVPPLAYKIHNLIEKNMLIPAFTAMKIIGNENDYSLDSFITNYKTSSLII